MTPNVGKAIAGGFGGTTVLTLMMRFVAPMITGQSVDMPEKLGDMSGLGLIGGMIIHFFIGSVIFGLIYAFVLFRLLPGAPWQKGLLSGVIFWLGLQIVMMPMIGGGVFSSQMGGVKTVVATLIAHLVYGTTLGSIAGGPVLEKA
jgi:uncharacterized membrane protein YagU involved in acid resistance